MKMAKTGSTTILLVVLVGAVVVAQDASAAVVCGCKKVSNGRVRRITAGMPLTCGPTQSLTCWNEAPADIGASVSDTSGTVSIDPNTHTAVPFNAEFWDNGDLHSTAADTSRITVPEAGMYLATGVVAYRGEVSQSGYRLAYFKINGTTDRAEVQLQANAAPGGETFLTTAAVLKLNASDYVELWTFHTAGVPILLYTGGTGSEFTVQKLN
jgi:hypothetical protein